jgi:hypothetical protein
MTLRKGRGVGCSIDRRYRLEILDGGDSKSFSLLGSWSLEFEDGKEQEGMKYLAFYLY